MPLAINPLNMNEFPSALGPITLRTAHRMGSRHVSWSVTS